MIFKIVSVTPINYGYTDNRQTNLATIGAGTITITKPETSAEGLNRDVTISQYNTYSGGLKGGVTVDTATVALIKDREKTIYDTVGALKDGLTEADKTADKIEQEAKTAIDNAGTWIDDNWFNTDEEVKFDETKAKEEKESAENPQNVNSTDKSIQDLADQKLAEGNEAAKEKADELARRGTPTEETNEIMRDADWIGDPIENTENPKVIDQTSMDALKAAGLPEHSGACVFLSTVYGAADAMGITLSPEDVAAIYKDAKKNRRVDVDWGTYGVQNFPGLINSVAAVKGIDASNISIPDDPNITRIK